MTAILHSSAPTVTFPKMQICFSTQDTSVTQLDMAFVCFLAIWLLSPNTLDDNLNTHTHTHKDNGFIDNLQSICRCGYKIQGLWHHKWGHQFTTAEAGLWSIAATGRTVLCGAFETRGQCLGMHQEPRRLLSHKRALLNQIFNSERSA